MTDIRTRRVPEKGVFVLSLDCEGLWGMADSQATMTDGVINDRTLEQAYDFLDRTLDRCGVRATAAFVSAFAAGRDVIGECLPEIRELAAMLPGWFSSLLPRLERGDAASLDGLEGRCHWQRLASAGHEIGWHGSTHIPLHDATPAVAVDIELALAHRLCSEIGGPGRSVIWPRNLVGHRPRVRAAGFTDFRAGPLPGRARRVASLLREFHILDRGSGDRPRCCEGWRVAPAGFFLNWPMGVRRVVPIQATVRRWKSMLRDAARTGGYVHMWFHPHNFITAPAMAEAFSAIVEEVASLVRSGDLLSLSMVDANALSWEAGQNVLHR